MTGCGDLHTTYFSGLGNVWTPPEDAAILGVVRWLKNPVRQQIDRNVEAVAPPGQLLRPLKARIGELQEDDSVAHPRQQAWREVDFEDQYREFLANAGQQQVLDQLRRRLRNGHTLVLVCYEGDPSVCHRSVLAEVLTDTSGPVGDVDVVQHPSRRVSDQQMNSATASQQSDSGRTTLGDFAGDSA